MSSTPDYPTANRESYNPNSELAIKIAEPQIILGEEPVGLDIMASLVYDVIGAQEIINISRHDLINGQNVIYQPIKNITNLFYQYNPQNILALQDTDREYFKRFSIDLSKHIPDCGSGYDIVNSVNVPNCKYVYIDPQTGSLIVDVVNILPGQDVEVQIMSEGSLLDDTIYEEEL
jgi:hypothetical protein